MENANKKREKQFHDSWAFILFMLLTIILNTIYIFNTSNFVDVTVKFYNDYKLGQLLLGNLVFTISIIAFSLVLCYSVPKFLIILSILLVPAASIAAWFFGAKDSSYSTVVGTVLLIINLIFILIVSIVILSHLDYIAKVISVASLIFFMNILGILLVITFVTSIFVLLSIPALLVDSTEPIIQNLRYLEILMASWQFFIALYFVQVFISSIIAAEVQKSGDVFGAAFTNSCYALGSISYGALLVAIVTTLQAMIQDARSRNRDRNERPNLLLAITGAIASLLLDILGDIIKFANAIAFPYLSVNGTSYEESVAKSFQILTNSGFEKVASISGVGFVIFTMMLSFFGSSMLFNYYFFLSYIGLSGDPTQNIIVSIVVTVLFGFIFGMVFSLLRAAVLALIYTTIAMPDETKEFDPEFVEILNEKKRQFEPAEASH
ncbi:uncharacterized protein VICG_01135 [Vittaforma corneae ATCC 50505]|uniref:Protein PNS1 n=1 Tax=Vittaforma corneae (strain ATCC 50505) TaxID=993615 RepID=L2GLL7_VITCO|nr:uncharacterized protein VICG_01135 [Vittaforma corneae ATCC 50505]ELA41783.1 hypothetical protein VICG_01135 [Vittaforma corneae ATCC 50505]